MAIVNLISIAEADQFNSMYAEWLSLSDPDKDNHIFNSSLYMQTIWSCENIDWSDPLTLTDNQKLACARYAEADRRGLLFPSMEEHKSYGRITEDTKKLGTLLKTVRYAETGRTFKKNPLTMIDSIMLVECSKKLTSTVELSRV